jgi:serine protease Do
MADNTDDEKTTENAPLEWTPPRAGSERVEPVKRTKPTLLTSTDDVSDMPKPPLTDKFTFPGGPSIPSKLTRPLEISLIAIVVLALGFGGGWLGAAAHGNDATDVTENKVQLEGEATVISDIAKNVGQSVVSVNVTSQSSGSTDTNPLDSLFGTGSGSSGSQTQEDSGTGMILTSGGLIMTNRHVIPDGTTNVSVTLSDGTVYNNVKVVGRTADSSSLDVAFLQIPNTNGKTLVPVQLGDSSKVNVGDQVVAIGNALGQFQNTVTSGIISGYGRSVQASASDGSSSESLDGLFQTDAAINEGNSGGPLVNLDGQVIGMNTAIASNSQNIGFAIPLNDLTGLIQGVEKTGQLQQPYLGVLYVPITSDVASQYNLSVNQGAYIPTATQNSGQATVVSGSPADKAGVRPGDIITKVDGTTINQNNSLTSALDSHQVGDSVNLTIVRGGKTMNISVTLGAVPSSSGN